MGNENAIRIDAEDVMVAERRRIQAGGVVDPSPRARPRYKADSPVRGIRPVTSSQDRLVHIDYAYAPESS